MSANRVALVTGAASGIGRAIAERLAGAGYDVVVNYSRSGEAARATAERVQAHGVRAVLAKADVSVETEVRALIDTLAESFGGRLDLLVNNAGTTIDIPPAQFDTVSAEAFDRVFAVNVRGLFLVTKHAVRLLRATPGAAVINTASIVGLRPGPQPLPYSASKAAIISMTQTLAGALGPAIRVNALAPGWMEGEWMERALGGNYERLMERRAKATPLGRCVTAEDVAEVAVSLATSMKFVTGQTIVVDGGYAAIT